jgi:hypothetical protein
MRMNLKKRGRVGGEDYPMEALPNVLADGSTGHVSCNGALYDAGAEGIRKPEHNLHERTAWTKGFAFAGAERRC